MIVIHDTKGKVISIGNKDDFTLSKGEHKLFLENTMEEWLSKNLKVGEHPFTHAIVKDGKVQKKSR